MYSKKANIVWPFVLLAFVFFLGTYGYYYIENWDIIDCFYMTLITISTIGYGEVHTLSYTGRIFTSFLIIIGVGTMGYALGSITQYIVEGEIRRFLGQKKMEKDIQSLSNHFIICGYGGVGRQACKELKFRKLKALVIELRSEMIELAQKDGFLALQGDATVEECLLEAGIMKAKSLITSIGSDAGNVFITLSAKALNPNIFVVVRAETISSEKKLLRAGADRVISPDMIGGRKMALAAIRPNIVEFMDIVTLNAHTGYRIEELVVKKGAYVMNKTLLESNIRQKSGVIIIGIKKDNGHLIFNHSSDICILENDILIAVGDSEQLKKLFQMTHSEGEKEDIFS